MTKKFFKEIVAEWRAFIRRTEPRTKFVDVTSAIASATVEVHNSVTNKNQILMRGGARPPPIFAIETLVL